MQGHLRLAYLIAAVMLLLAMPWGQASVILILFVAADLGAAALMLRPEPVVTAPSIVSIGGDPATVSLLRRTVPELRMRRPAVAIDAQIKWRQAAAAARRRNELGFSLRH